MTEERLADIEQEIKDYVVVSKHTANDLIQALRVEREKATAREDVLNYAIECRDKELEAERAKVTNLQDMLSIIMEKESNIHHQKGYTLIANPNYPVRYITKDGLVDVQFIDG